MSGIPSSAVHLTITRTAGGESLRIPGQVQVVGPEALVVDTAVAPGRINTYLVEAFDLSGALVANVTQDAAGPVDSACAAVWLSDPLDETSGMWLEAQGPQCVRTHMGAGRDAGSAYLAAVSPGVRWAAPRSRSVHDRG